MDHYEISAEDMLFAKKLAAQFYRQNAKGRVSIEELFSTAMLSLCESSKRFDASRGICFSTFAYLRIRGAMFEVYKKEHRWNQEALAQETGSEQTNANCAYSLATLAHVSPEKRCILAELRCRVQAILSGLPLHQQQIIALRYFQDFRFEEIASTLGRQSKSWVSTHHTRALKSLAQGLQLDYDALSLSA